MGRGGGGRVVERGWVEGERRGCWLGIGVWGGGRNERGRLV